VPLLETDAVDDIGRNQFVVKRGDQIVIDQHVETARFVFEVLDLAHQLVVVREEWRARVEVAADQRIADENFARIVWIDQTVVDAALAVDDQTVQRCALIGRHLRSAFFPARFAVGFFQQMTGDALQPFRLDLRNAARVQTRRIDQLGRHDPLAGFLDQRRTWPDVKLDGTRAKVMLFFFRLETDVAEQACQQRRVQLFVGCRRFVQAPALLSHNRQQLRMHIAPFAQPQLRQEVGAAFFLQQSIRFFVRDCVFKPFPDFQITLEFGFFIGEFFCAHYPQRLCASIGRSRGSCTDSADAMISTSVRQTLSFAARIMRPTRGSSGIRASSRPSLVR
jgi:hypothetical protein